MNEQINYTRIGRLVDVVYSAGMDEESEELKEMFNWLTNRVEALEKENDRLAGSTHKRFMELNNYTQFYKLSLKEIRRQLNLNIDDDELLHNIDLIVRRALP